MFASALFASLIVSGFQETLYPDWRQTFTVDEVIYQEKTDFWDLAIFENRLFGRVMAMDGIIQLTEKDEFNYHEMLAHVPLFTHPNPKSVLIIGGGDGGLLREVIKHESLETILLVEIDAKVIDLSKKYFPTLANGAFEHPKVKLVIQDASKFVKKTKEFFDVILIDSNDPEGAAAILFSKEFYGDCKKILNPGGILANQNGVPFLQKEELKLTFDNRRPHFKQVGFYVTAVPTYSGGLMALGWASDKKYKPSEKTLKERRAKVKGKMRYYTPAVHRAAFALPEFMLEALD